MTYKNYPLQQLTAILLERNKNMLKAGRPPIQPDCVYDGNELLGCRVNNLIAR